MPRVKWDGDASTAVQAQEAMTKAAKKFKDETKEAATASKTLDAAARRIAENVNPQEKYNRKMAKLKTHVDAGRISLGNAELTTKKHQAELERAGESGKKAFGGLIPDIVGMATQLGAVLGPLALIKAGFDDITAAVEKARQESVDARRGMGSLRQLANSDADFQNLKSKAKSLYGIGAVKTLDEGAQAVFSLASAGQLNEESFTMFAGLAQKGVVDPGALAKAVKQYQSGFGSEEIGDTAAIISKAFAASANSPATVEGLLGASPQLAAVSSGLGSATRSRWHRSPFYPPALVRTLEQHKSDPSSRELRSLRVSRE